MALKYAKRILEAKDEPQGASGRWANSRRVRIASEKLVAAEAMYDEILQSVDREREASVQRETDRRFEICLRELNAEIAKQLSDDDENQA